MEHINRTIKNIQNKIDAGWIVVVGLSGKDSFSVAHCTMEALKNAREVNPNAGPVHFITTDTTHDNYELQDYMSRVHDAINDYAQEHELNAETHFLRPALNAQPIVEYIGRGKLLRTPQTTQNGRSCAVDWKIDPAKRFNKSLKKRYQTTKILNISGSRSEESGIRAANIEKRGETIDTIAETELGYTMAPIKDWSLQNVWGLVAEIDNGLESFGDCVADELRKHYAAGNGGTCDLYAKSTDKKASCGSRFGCWSCAMVSNDDSLQQQIITSERTYGYMSELPKLRKFMVNTLFDMERSRSFIGRQLLKEHWLKVNFNQYSLDYRKELLRYSLTIDAKEMARAENVGEDPKFTLVTHQQLVAIQYYWSREGGELLAGEAFRIWHDVHTEGNWYEIPETVALADHDPASDANFVMGKRLSSKSRYFDLNTLYAAMGDIEMPGLGLQSGEMFDGNMSVVENKDGTIESVLPVSLTDRFTIDPVRAEWYVEDHFVDLMEDIADVEVDPTCVLKDLLQSGIIQVRKGEVRRLHRELKQAQAINAMARVTPAYSFRMYKASVSEQAFKAAVEREEAKGKENEAPQMDMFAA